MTIGQLAKAAKIGIQAIRFYEREGLLPEPERKTSGYRIYPQETLARLQWIQRAKSLGFSLVEIRDFLDLLRFPLKDSRVIKKRASAKLLEIEEKIQSLCAIRDELRPLVEACEGKETPLADCPILRALEESSPCCGSSPSSRTS